MHTFSKIWILINVLDDVGEVPEQYPDYDEDDDWDDEDDDCDYGGLTPEVAKNTKRPMIKCLSSLKNHLQV